MRNSPSARSAASWTRRAPWAAGLGHIRRGTDAAAGLPRDLRLPHPQVVALHPEHQRYTDHPRRSPDFSLAREPRWSLFTGPRTRCTTASPATPARSMRRCAGSPTCGKHTRGFIVQIVPMRENYHQYEEMVRLARSSSPRYQGRGVLALPLGLRLAARNRTIASQRLDPASVVALDPPDVSYEERAVAECMDGAPGNEACAGPRADDRLFASCIAVRREFHVDPYGGMTFCCVHQGSGPALRPAPGGLR